MVTRLSGLASGMDTEKMVSDLMKAHRVKLDKIQQKKQYVEWQRDDYRAVNKKLFDFRTLANDTMLRQSTFAQKTASSSSPDDVSVRNVSSMSNFSGTVSVQQLAEKATMRSTAAMTASATDISTKKLSDTNLLNTTNNQTIKIRAMKADGTLQTATEETVITFNPAEKTLQDVIDEINQKSNVSAFYDSVTGKIQMSAKYSGSNTTSTGADTGKEIVLDFSGAAAFQSFTKLSNDNLAAIGQGTMMSSAGITGIPATSALLSSLGITTQTLTIGSLKTDGTLQTQNVAIDTNKTLQQTIDDITNQTGVTATYDSVTGKITLLADNAGDKVGGNEIELTADGNFLSVTNLAANNANQKTNSSGSEGLNAKFTLDGLATERSSNTFTINGFELTLKKASNTNVTFTSVTDTDKIFESVKKFIDDYNSLIENLNGELRETRYRDYQPLTSEQKEAMKDKEIDLWEEKAKSGTLRNDSILSGMLTKMRSLLNSSVSGVTGADRLSELGITPSTNRLDNGKLIINESKLREAITADPNQVYELFAANGTENSDGTLNADNGLARRLVSILDDARTKVIAKAGSEGSVNNKFTLGRALNSYNDQINRYEDRLKSIETRYWKQFTAMETSIQKANSQSAQIMNYFSSGN